MTVIRLPEGVWIHSAVPITDALAAEIEALGPVAHIVAPNTMHHLHAAAAADRWPEATLWMTPELAHKRPDLRSLTGTRVLVGESPWPGVEVLAIAGAPTIGEAVFFHVASKTLLVTDLLFNVTDASGLLGLVLRGMGAFRVLAQSRVWRFAARDKAALAESGKRLLEWEFDRLIPCHGDIVDAGAHDRVRAALEGWMLRA
jgi:hypothetical protein